MEKNFTAEDKYKEKQNTVLVVCKSLLTLVYKFKDKNGKNNYNHRNLLMER